MRWPTRCAGSPVPPEPAPVPATTAGRALACELLRARLAVRAQVTGASMGIALPAGSVVEIEPLARRPRAGDVVLADAPASGPMLHRVVRRLPGTRVQTRGDACWRADAPVPESAVLGRVRRARRPGGRWRRPAPAALRWCLARALLALSQLAARLPGHAARGTCATQPGPL